MKKRKRERVLALILVFVLASVANATLIIVDANAVTVDLDVVVTVVIYSDAGGFNTYDFGVYLNDPTSGDYPSKAELQNGDIASYPAAGGSSSIILDHPGGYEGYDFQAKRQVQPPNPISAGNWAEVEFVGHLVSGVYNVNLYDYTADGGTYSSPPVVADTKSITVLPEPATIALLGLGGLLLMRRRK